MRSLIWRMRSPLSSKDSISAQLQQLDRRISGLKSTINDIREEQEALREDVEALKEFETRASDRFEDMDEKFEEYGDRLRDIAVNKGGIADLDLRLQGKVGNSDFESLEERVKQLQARMEFVSAAIDKEQQEY